MSEIVTETNNTDQPNPQAKAWEDLGNKTDDEGNTITSTSFESNTKGTTFVKGPDGKMIPKEDYDAAMEAKEREEYYKNHPEARDMEVLRDHLEKMENNPDRLENFEGEHSRGAGTRNSEYTSLTTMYKTAPDGSPLNNAARKNMAQMMHDAEDLQAFEENEQYKDYIERERAKIGTTYKNRADFNHKVVARLNQLVKKHEEENAKANEEANTDADNETDVETKPDEDDKTKDDEEARAKAEEEDRVKREEEIKAKTIEDEESALIQELKYLEAEKKALETILEKKKNSSDAEALKQLEADLKSAKQGVSEWREKLAESYAKNRGLFVSGKARAEFVENQKNYKESLNRYLSIQAKINLKTGRAKNTAEIQSVHDNLEKEIESGKIDIDKANQALGENWDQMEKQLKADISAEFVKTYVDEQKALEAETIHRIDKGNLYRKIVSKVINNKPLKAVITVAGLAGLAATGVGLASGALAVGISYTAGGIAAGAAKGALSGLVMSRQDSKNSAIHGFAGSSEEIEKQLRGIDAAENTEDVNNVTSWLLKRYNEANKVDHSSNVKRTAIATGIGALIGGLTSGVRIDQVKTTYKDKANLVGYEETQYKAADLESVNHAKGTGTQQFFRELGGDGDAYYSSGAHEQMAEVIKKYGMSVGENDWTYPGPISEWPETARQAFSEVADEWAKKGLVNAIKTGGEPVYDVVTEASRKLVSDKMHNFFVSAASVIGAGAIGGAISGMRNRIRGSNRMPVIDQAKLANLPINEFDNNPQVPIQDSAQNTEANPETQANTEANTALNNPADTAPTPNDNQEPAQSSQPTQPTPNQAPNSIVDQGNEDIRSAFLNLVGEDGVRFMTDTARPNETYSDELGEWWKDLSEEARNAVISFEEMNRTANTGKALRAWLENQGILS